MEITRTPGDGTLDVGVAGRLDGYWADHLDRALTDVVREGHHHIRLDCSALSFLSSAGIAVLVKFHKELARVNGAFYVVNPSKAVSLSLRITRLADLLREPVPSELSAVTRAPARRVDQHGTRFEIYELARAAPLTYRTIGSGNPLSAGAYLDEHCFSLESMTPTFVVGVGAFGDSFADCRTRFGELLSVAGATAYQPADGANVPDYLVASGALASDVRMLYCLACEGQFSYLVRFESIEPGSTIGFARLAATCLEAASSPAIGIVIVAEAAGLVGGALRRSPAQSSEADDFFAYPQVRTRLTFTAEPAFARSVALAAGVITRTEGGGPENGHPQLRPIGAECAGHVHAAAFRFRPIRKGPIDFRETVTGLFEANQLLGVLHLLHDDRGAAGAGESEFVRGACWIGPIANGSSAF